ncbi:MAG: HipA domain-containing protein [Burkholderiales bacterium]
MTSERHVYVYVQLPGTLNTVPAALLKVEKLRDGTFVGRFRYGDRYLERKDAVELDPFQLPLGDRVYEFTKLKGIPGAVRDAGPDAWGRRVIEHKLERSPADLEEIDYLLHGPQDGAGYLSFGTTVAPPTSKRRFNRTHQLADLVAAAEAIEEGKRLPEQILEPLEPGTSMGGARPKATLEDGNRLWIGKFPERADRCNLQRVEHATIELARRCGIDVCNSRLEAIGGRDVLMVERFDREHTEGGYRRFGLVSALTMLDCDESHLDRERWSYPLLADQLRRWSEQPDRDRLELFRRMVFNAAVTNNDDHPRNHAVRRTARGWRLTPAYDLVPMPVVSLERRDLAMTIGTYGRTASLYNLLSQCGRFGLSTEAAVKEIERIAATLGDWRAHLRVSGVSAKDVEYIAPAFLPECFFFERPSQAEA